MPFFFFLTAAQLELTYQTDFAFVLVSVSLGYYCCEKGLSHTWGETGELLTLLSICKSGNAVP